MDLAELQRQADEAKARRAAAALSAEQEQHAKLLASIEDDTGAARADEARQRAIRGATLEAEERKKAGGRYRVQFFDLGKLLPDMAGQLPGAGVLVLRSPPGGALDTFYRELEANDQSAREAYMNLVCASVVNPTPDMGFRGFLESDLGCGTAMPIGDAAAALGGAVQTKRKRGRG